MSRIKQIKAEQKKMADELESEMQRACQRTCERKIDFCLDGKWLFD